MCKQRITIGSVILLSLICCAACKRNTQVTPPPKEETKKIPDLTDLETALAATAKNTVDEYNAKQDEATRPKANEYSALLLSTERIDIKHSNSLTYPYDGYVVFMRTKYWRYNSRDEWGVRQIDTIQARYGYDNAKWVYIDDKVIGSTAWRSDR